MNLLISIKQEYTNQIFAGTKTVEYRKGLPKKCGTSFSMLIYESCSEVKKIVGYATVSKIIEKSPEKLWKETHNIGGIEEKKFFAYFDSCDKAYAFQLENVKKFKHPIALQEIGIKSAPQMWMYVSDEDVKKVIALGK